MGGVIGHIWHPHENLSLTFRDLYSLIGFITSGKFSDHYGVQHFSPTEKFDGQQLSISWRNNRGLLLARNKGHVKNFGKAALTRDKLIDKFESHICFKAFLYAYDDLDIAISDMTPTMRNLIFDNGRKWMSLEVIYPDTTNVISYDKKIILFHYTVRYDQDGTPRGELDRSDADDLFKAVRNRKTLNYTFESPNIVQTADISKWNMRFFNQLKDIYDTYDLNYLNTIGDYLKVHFTKILNRHLNFNIINTNDTGRSVIDSILRRFVYGDKSFTLPQIKKFDEGLSKWVKKYEKEELKFELKYALRPLEKCFLELGTLLIYKTPDEQFLLKGNIRSSEILTKRLRDALETIPIVDQKLNHQIYLLYEISNVVPDHIPTTEGLVFNFNGEMYKLTGCFAPINQILGQQRF